MSKEYVGGRNAVLECLANKRLAVDKLLVAKTASGSKIDQAKIEADNRTIPIGTVQESKLTSLTGNRNHQGLVVEVSGLHPYSLEDLLERTADNNHRRLFVLDRIQDPVNLGKLARSALYFSYEGLVKTTDRTAPLSGAVIESSAGAAARLPIAQVTNLQQALETLKNDRFWLVGTVLEATRCVGDVPTDRDLAVVLGHEGCGLRRLTRDQCDYLVKIPGGKEFESLNVATAGAVSAYALKPKN